MKASGLKRRLRAYRIVLLGIGFASLYWIIEAGFDALGGIGSFAARLLPLGDANELWMRITTAFIIVAFGCFAQVLVNRRERTERALREARDELEARVEERTAELARVNEGLREGEDRLRLLAEASRSFAEAGIEYERLLATIARIVAENLGDYCVVVLASEDGQWINPVAFHHTDPELLALNREMMSRLPMKIGEGVTGRVVQTGEPAVVPVVTPEQMHAMTKPEHRPYLDRIGVHSMLVVPLRARDRVLGAIAISRNRPGNPYTDEDLRLLEDLADRAALAIDNALLHRASEGELAARREAEEKYRGIFENAIEGICQVTRDGRILTANPAMASIFGYETPEELVASVSNTGHQLWENPEEREEYVRRVREQGSVSGFETTMCRKDGARIHVSINAHALGYATDGEIEAIEGTVEDITARRHAEEISRRLAAIVESSGDAIIGKTLDGIITDWNQGARRLYGYTAEEVVGRHISILAPPELTDEITGILRRLRRGERIAQHETVRVTKDGRRLDISLSVSPIADAGGNVLGASTIARDITERKKAEETLRESEERLRLALESARFGEWSLDLVTGAAQRSLRHDRIFGYEEPPAEWSYETFLQHVLPEDHALVDEEFRLAMERNEEWNFECRIRRVDGEVRWIWARGDSFKDAEGQPIRMHGLVADITERKRAEEELIESEARTRAVLDALTEGVVFLDTDGVVRSANDAVRRVLGRSLEELADPALDPRWQLVRGNGTPFPVEEQPAIVALRTGQTVRNVEMGVPRPDGTLSWISVNAQPVRDTDGNVLGAVASFFDITERKQSEDALRESEERFRATFEQAAVGAAHVGFDGRWIRVNRKLCEIVGYTAEELLAGLTFQDITHPDDLNADLAQVERLLAGEISTYSMEKRYFRKDGSLVWINLTGSLVRAPSGEPRYFIAIIEDITERRQFEEELRASEERYRTLFESIDQGFCVIESLFDENDHPIDYRLLEINPAFEEQTGLVDAVGCRMRELVPDIEEHWIETYGNVALTGEPIRFENGSVPMGRWFDVYAFRIGGQESRRVAILFKDITERKRAEEALRRFNETLGNRVNERTAQLEATNAELEAFSYSVSHDLRAPLRHINGFAEMLQNRASSSLDETSLRYLRVILESTKRAGDLIDDLLAFSRVGRAGMQRSAVDTGRLVRGIVEALSFESDGREVEWRIEDLSEVDGDSAMLRLVFENLLSNAFKYTGPREGAVIEVGSYEEGDETIFFVRDNGVGFDEKYAEKLFGVFQRLHRAEEFEGTGIGLANVRRIVHRHGGRVWAEGRQGEGATFYFSIPKIPKEEDDGLG